ncbi:MAG: response regulator [Clostridiales Family XIII bacterium]|jgi:signal transduction histidine kinase/ActR/RegA family two-component response regulator|nr:response regulator [Clostridiales Family XIII bacterium]
MTEHENVTIEQLQEVVHDLKRENSRLNRELRASKRRIDNIDKTINAREVFTNTLKASEAKQKSYIKLLLQNCPSPIILLDERANIVLYTTAFHDDVLSSGYRGFIDGKNIIELLDNNISIKAVNRFDVAIMDVLTKRETHNLQGWVEFNDDRAPEYYSIDILPVGNDHSDDDEITTESGALIIINNLTDLVNEKENAEHANRAKSDFLATMSHEIRTPMNAIVGMAEMMRRSNLDDSQTKYIADISKASTNLLSIINDILDFSKIEAGKLELLVVSFNLHALLDNLRSMFSHMFKIKNIDFIFEISDTIPEHVLTDEKRLNQILTNILSNALKYTNTGSVTFSADAYNDGSQDVLVFNIHDTGIGIKEEDKEKLFMPFEQLDSRKNKNVIGTGLGLAICNELAHMLGGEILMSSVYGKGSTFTVEVPYRIGVADNEISKIHGALEFKTADARVLVVDDIDINLDVAEALLGIFGVNPELTSCGQDAINLATKNQYDIIFMDHMMPEMDGIVATKHIRDLGGYNANVPIVALTANAISGMREMFLDNGFTDFVAKPLEVDELARALTTWLPAEKILKVV